jgi:hypothetical protein
MTIEDFAALTRRIIAREGFEGWLPTACYPALRHVAVLQGVPEGVDAEQAALEWASRKADADEEYLVACKVDGLRFKVVRVSGAEKQEAVYEIEHA